MDEKLKDMGVLLVKEKGSNELETVDLLYSFHFRLQWRNIISAR
jgi:hypothetical protein